MIFGLLILWKCNFEIQDSIIYFLKTQISFIKHILQNNYQKAFLDFHFNCYGNKKLNQNNGCNELLFSCNNVKGLQTSKNL